MQKIWSQHSDPLLCRFTWSLNRPVHFGTSESTGYHLLFITNWVSNATSIQDIFHTSEVFIDDEWKINSSYNHKGFVWWREQGILLKWTVQCVMSSYKSCSSQHCTFTSIYIYILVLGQIILLPLSKVLKTWNRKIIRSKVHLIHKNNSKY